MAWRRSRVQFPLAPLDVAGQRPAVLSFSVLTLSGSNAGSNQRRVFGRSEVVSRRPVRNHRPGIPPLRVLADQNNRHAGTRCHPRNRNAGRRPRQTPATPCNTGNASRGPQPDSRAAIRPVSVWSDPPIVNSTLSEEEGAGDIRQSPLARQIAPVGQAVLAALLVGP